MNPKLRSAVMWMFLIPLIIVSWIFYLALSPVTLAKKLFKRKASND